MKRITCSASLVIALACSMEARAGGPPPVYMVIDKVVFEPDADAPTRIQIWGAFALLREGVSYGSPVRGYLYYAAAPGAEEKCRKEWAALKRMTNQKQLISFGFCREPNVRDHLRKPDEKVASPILYPNGKGGFALGKNAESKFLSLKKLLVSAATKLVAADLTKIDRRIAKDANLQLQQLKRADNEQGSICIVSIEVKDKYRQYGSVRFADRPQDAPLLHFDGPLTMGFTDPDKQVLARGDQRSQINAWIGTPSPGKRQGATVVLDHSKGVPFDIHPVVSIEFPNKDPNGMPITITAVLNQRC